MPSPRLREPMRVSAKIRHRRARAGDDRVARERRELVTFDSRSAPSLRDKQFVFYDGECVVGGGWIAETKKN